MLTVSQLYIYPIKSLGGIQVQSALLTDRGFEYDRRWMLVDDQNRFLTQRELPKMALLQVALQLDDLLITHKQTGDAIKVSFQPSGATCTVTVWDDQCPAQYVDEKADAWFSNILSLPCRLVYMPDDSLRRIDPNYAHKEEITSFSDGYPLLLLGQASLDDLNSRLPQPITMDRFRPNIVFTGGEPFQEDALSTFRIGTTIFHGVKPCARCVITTIDPATGVKGKEPLKTLSSYRQQNNKLFFGQNLLLDTTTMKGNICVGDVIIPL